jgi:G6PDH family F420-dependent oxidoreductase
MHPAIVAQAAATAARLFEGRFMLGLGSGENLNEHILGHAWPEPIRRLEMLEEAIDVIRALWSGETVVHRGRHFTVEEARLFTLPEQVPPILVAASGPVSARLAGEAGDGLVAVAPDPELVSSFEDAGGGSAGRYAQMTVCFAADERTGRRRALEAWPNSGLGGDLSWEIKTVELFDSVVELVREEDLSSIVCGADVDVYMENVEKFVDAGFDHVWLHQVGTEQDAFLEFCEKKLLPRAR